MDHESRLSIAAAVSHEANRAYCLSIGDASQPHWEDAPEWQRNSAIKGALGAIDGATPENSHEGWLAEKEATGWKYGPKKDPDKKEHPCMVPYSDLPEGQKVKDHLFTAVVKAVYHALA